MKKNCVMTGDPKAIAYDLKRVFGFKVKKVEPVDVPLKDGTMDSGYVVTYKTTKKNYKKYLNERTRYGF